MATKELQGNTLGEKHRHYNKLVKEALNVGNQLQAGDIDNADTDINNLVKIDVAAKKRDVKYILKVLQSEDLLYVSRAIKQSPWLITDRQYSHIINPQYLHTHLFQQMTSKACAKLTLHIRLHLKDEDRVEGFYNFIKEKDIGAALKWLPHCSVTFIEKELEKYDGNINYRLLKRLCERSITIFKIYAKKDCGYFRSKNFEKLMFLLNTNSGIFLDIVEDLPPYQIPSFGSKATSVLMKICPQRIIDKFEKYCDKIDLPTFAKYMKNKDIPGFISKISENKEMKRWMKYDKLKHFVRYLPKEGRFDYLKKVFIDKSEKKNEDCSEDEETLREIELCAYSSRRMRCSDSVPLRSSANIYHWYRFAPFEVAFAELIKLIRAESAPAERIAMFGVLLSCAGRNTQQIQTVLQLYNDKHINEPFKFKIQFVNMLLSKTNTYKFDKTSWNTLNNIFHSMEVYIESDNNVQSCVEAIILYKLLHNESVPEIIDKKFKFNTLKSIQKNITNEEKEIVFQYLLQILDNKIKTKTLNTETELNNAVETLNDIQTLLMDWKKNIAEYPWFLKKVKEIIKIRHENSWKTNLSTLYHKNKSWRKEMFTESLLLSPSEETCYNALKHDSSLITNNKITVEELFGDDNQNLNRVLRTLRVHWSQTLASDWLNWYLARLSKPGGHKAVIRGLCTLAPLPQVIDIIKKYAPKEAKINWSEDHELVLSLRKYLGRNMYWCRPLPPPEIVLLYAKGDYLQFALPSLNAVLHNMSIAQTRNHMTKLLDVPVSLQKHGIRFAFTKLESEELKKVFHEMWKKAKNPTIRTVLFTQTHKLLCKQKTPAITEEIWELISIFIDNLSTDENKLIYDTLAKFEKVPLTVCGKYFMKSFKFLKGLPPKANCQNTIANLVHNMRNLVEHLDHEFVADVLLDSLDKKFTTERYQYSELMASYLLCSRDAESQIDRYKKVVLPVLERSFALWDVKIKEDYWASINVITFLKDLSQCFPKFVFDQKMVFPTKLFLEIQTELEKRLPVEKHYRTQTTWKLIASYVKHLEEHKDLLSKINVEEENKSDSYYDPKYEKKWNNFYIKAVPDFSKVCLDYLREDVKKYFPSIYWIFASCLEKAFAYIHEQVYIELLKSLLVDEDFIPSYLIVLKNTPNYYTDECKPTVEEIRKKIFANPSLEIKMHYFRKYDRESC